MDKQLLEKRKALQALEYFRFFNGDQIAMACKLCILRQFEPLDIIYYEDKGQFSYVNFVLSGECMILQRLELMVTVKNDTEKFDLYEMSKIGDNDDFQEKSKNDKLKQNIRNKWMCEGKKGESVVSLKNLNARNKLITHLIDVGSISFGGIFSLGEKSEHRTIVARKKVQCMMIPRFWLFEKDQNPGNIWQRRRFYLDSTIPSCYVLFNDFINTRRWQKFKNDIINHHCPRTLNANSTHIKDVPVICHIVDSIEC